MSNGVGMRNSLPTVADGGCDGLEVGHGEIGVHGKRKFLLIKLLGVGEESVLEDGQQRVGFVVDGDGDTGGEELVGKSVAVFDEDGEELVGGL